MTYFYTCVIQVQLFGFKDQPNCVLWMILTVVSTEISLWEHSSTLFSCTFKSSFWIGLMWSSEAGTRGVLYEKLILRRATLLKRRPWHGCFPVNFEKFLRNLFTRHLPDTVSGSFEEFIHTKFFKNSAWSVVLNTICSSFTR